MTRRLVHAAAAAVKPPTESDAPPFEQELLASIEAVHRFALHLARDAAAAEDLVQETYLRALAHRDQYTPGSNCRAWLFTICRNVFVKGATRAAREVATEDAKLEAMGAAAVHGSVAAADPTGALFERTDVDDAVRKALEKLPEEYRTVVALVDIEDQSYGAVAEILGIPVGTVRSRLFRGRRLLQQDLLAYAMDAGLITARQDGITELWEYPDGELPVERAAPTDDSRQFNYRVARQCS